MARFARVVALGTPHHVTQRGNARQFILMSDSERLVYLDLLRHYGKLHQLSLLGYCLMSNHVHLIVIPRHMDSLSKALKNAHGRYAAYWNAEHRSSGHVWQGRFYSCPLDTPHLWEALRYTELNPVRAGLVTAPETYIWSSAATHCGTAPGDAWLDMEFWQQCWTAAAWRDFLAAGATAEEADAIREEADAIRESTHTGRPLGTPEFIEKIESTTGRSLLPQKGGRPHKTMAETQQEKLCF